MILNYMYWIIAQIKASTTQVQISSIDYITRLALLIKVFIMTGLLYIILDLKFQGQTYIIVYVGAISILFLFVIKMTEGGRAPKLGEGSTKGRLEVIGIQLITLCVAASLRNSAKSNDLMILEPNNTSSINQFFTSSYSSEFITYTDISSFGYILYLAYPLITILIGILLWCVLIGILRISGSGQ